MYKSQMSQLVFAACFGPIGLIYSSMAAALVLSLLTVAVALAFLSQIVYVLIGSLILSVFVGDQLVCAYNRKRHEALRNPGMYLGGIRCRVRGAADQQPHYGAALNKVRWHRRIVAWCKYLGSPVIVFACIWFSQPEQIRQSFISSLQRIAAAPTEPTLAAARATEPPRPDSVLSQHSVAWQSVPSASPDDLVFALPARNFIDGPDGWMRPQLQLRCIDNRTSLLLVAKEVLGTERTQLTYRFDDGQQVSASWSLRADYRSAVADNPITLVRMLARHSDLQINYQPFHTGSQRTVHFELNSGSAPISEVRRQCGW